MMTDYMKECLNDYNTFYFKVEKTILQANRDYQIRYVLTLSQAKEVFDPIWMNIKQDFTDFESDKLYALRDSINPRVIFTRRLRKFQMKRAIHKLMTSAAEEFTLKQNLKVSQYMMEQVRLMAKYIFAVLQ